MVGEVGDGMALTMLALCDNVVDAHRQIEDSLARWRVPLLGRCDTSDIFTRCYSYLQAILCVGLRAVGAWR